MVYGFSSTCSDLECAGADTLGQRLGRLFIQQREVARFEFAGGGIKITADWDFFSGDRYQGGFQGLACRLGKGCQQIPPLTRDKGHPFPFPLDDQPDRHALHPPRRQSGPDLAPQQGRDFVAIQAIDNPPGFLGPHQAFVDIARACECFLDGILGDFVEYQAIDGHFRLEHLQQVPADCLPFTIFVRRQIEGIRTFSGNP